MARRNGRNSNYNQIVANILGGLELNIRGKALPRTARSQLPQYRGRVSCHVHVYHALHTHGG